MAKCFKCEKMMSSAVASPLDNDESLIWMSPCDGLTFSGGGTFGSSVYDTMVDGIHVQILICDECLRKHKNLLLEVQGEIG